MKSTNAALVYYLTNSPAGAVITGVVVNEATREFLDCAEVAVEGTALKAPSASPARLPNPDGITLDADIECTRGVGQNRGR